MRRMIAVAMLLLLPTGLEAQVRVTGQVRDSASGAPIERVAVQVVGGSASAITGADGRFVLLLPPGTHALELRRLGYRTLTTSIAASLEASGDLDLTMAIEAPTRAPEPRPPMASPTWPPGFEARRQEGQGVFVTDSMIRVLEPSTLARLLERSRTGVRFERVAGRNVAIGRRGEGASGSCHMAIWIDGINVYTPTTETGTPQARRQNPELRAAPSVDLDAIPTTNLAAVEVYRATQIPAQFRTGGSACGAILVWNKSTR